MRFNIGLVIFLQFVGKQVCQTARILSIFGFEGPAQYAFLEPLLLKLAERGHYVTSITNFRQTAEHTNLRSIVIEENFQLNGKVRHAISKEIGLDHFNNMSEMFTIGFQMCENILHNALIRDLMENESFDLILLNLLFSESLYGLAQHFNVPLVGISTIGSCAPLDSLFRNSAPLSYVPSVMLEHLFDENMSFWQRCLNVALCVLVTLYHNYEMMPLNKKYYQLRFPNASKTVEEVQKNISLILLNDHHAISKPKPYLPNMIEVAGLHIPEVPEPVAPQILKMLNADTHEKGFIYVAIEEHFPDNVMQNILNQFGMVKSMILWNSPQYPSAVLRVPSNVYFFRNLSHHGILSHPNCKLLISHGSYLSVIESIHYGIPILGLKSPHIKTGEKFNYVEKISTGISLKIAAKSLQDQQIYKAIQKSFQFRDRQNTPMQTAIYWLEYVLRHRGAPHLIHLGHNLNTWQFYN
ncbi:UDP-glycosyltransferase UGT4-like, partial [Musca vetustissima]|uniref:UDP-glycosyltransferase UGT4-like n=1 Tax=Musca vetustissima TaxID=27455 RepID=UPI002AB667DA